VPRLPRVTEWLYQIPGGKAFAYSTDGKNFFTMSENKAWAYRDGKWLYAFGATQAVGYFEGDTVFSLPDGKPRFTLRSA
jgi:hypothetical protein